MNQHRLFADRNYAAPRVPDNIFSLCRKGATRSDTKFAQGCTVLSAWIAGMRSTSPGAVLSREVWNAAIAIPNLVAIPFSPDDPVNMPRELRVSDPGIAIKLREALTKTIDKLADNGVPPDCPRGRSKDRPKQRANSGAWRSIC